MSIFYRFAELINPVSVHLFYGGKDELTPNLLYGEKDELTPNLLPEFTPDLLIVAYSPAIRRTSTGGRCPKRLRTSRAVFSSGVSSESRRLS